RALHIIEDMTSPPHVHGDTHLTDSLTIFGLKFGTYEPWEVNNWNFINTVTGNGARPGVTDYSSLLQQIATETNTDVRIHGQIQRSFAQPVTDDMAILFPNIAYTVGVSSTDVPEEWCDPTLGCNASGPGLDPSLFHFDDWWETPSNGGHYIFAENSGRAT